MKSSPFLCGATFVEKEEGAVSGLCHSFVQPLLQPALLFCHVDPTALGIIMGGGGAEEAAETESHKEKKLQPVHGTAGSMPL